MNKAELVNRVAELNDVETNAAASRIVEHIINTITSEVAAGNEVAISGLGTFSNVKRAATAEREGRNPSTGESITIPAKPEGRKAKFSIAAPFKRLVENA
jgi:DNA-binding protein HU-beta